MQITVLGASGYVGSRLVPELVAAGHQVVATATSASSLDRFWWHDLAQHAAVDVTDPDSVQVALKDCDAIVYLVHGMSSGDDFDSRDRLGAETVARAAAEQGVQRIVYLSGIIPQVSEDILSPHLRSRLEVERLLTGSGVPSSALRAAVVVGNGSASFEIVRQAAERLPVQLLPGWAATTQVQPIAVVDVVDAIIGALNPPSDGPYDVVGSDRVTYTELLQRYRATAGVIRGEGTVDGVDPGTVGDLAGMLTDLPAPLVSSLVESLQHDMVGNPRRANRDLLGHPPLGLDDAIRRSLAPVDATLEPSHRDPMGPLPGDPDWADGGTGLAGTASRLFRRLLSD